jgi:hypothetical protein
MSSADMATAACANLVQDRAGSSIYLHQHRPELLSGMCDPRMFEQLCPSLFPVGDGGPGTESERVAQSTSSGLSVTKTSFIDDRAVATTTCAKCRDVRNRRAISARLDSRYM